MITAKHNPYDIFANWLDQAKAHEGIIEPTAMSVATVDKNGKPNLRILLLKTYDKRGFCFFGHLDSQKFQDIEGNPNVALDFYWMPLKKQIRIKGAVEPLTPQEADAYFASRARDSQISAWASAQSKPLNGYSEFDAEINKYEKKFAGTEVPRPDFWAGYRLIPDTIEFWIGKEHRRHERYRFDKVLEGWDLTLLYP